MKNAYYEYKIQKSKATKKKDYWDLDPTYNLRIYHCYRDRHHISYWDDVGFHMGSQRVVVFWTHPRMNYADEIEMVAHNEAKAKFPPVNDIFDKKNYQKNFKRVGKSRKRVHSYTLKDHVDQDGYWDYFKELQEKYLRESDYKQKCFFKVTQLDYCRAVHICIPVEVRDESELNELTMIVRSLLKNPNKFQELYGDYEYTKDDYSKEFPNYPK